MDGNIFGSVMDLGALLGDGGLEGSMGDTDAFLKDLGDAELEPFELPKDFPAKTSSHTSSLSGVTGYDASNDEAETFRSAIPTMQFPQQFPSVQMWPTYPSMSMSAPPALKQSVSDNSSPNTAALLSQLLAAIKTNVAEQPDVQPKQEAFPVQSVPQQVVPKSAENMTVPSLTAQQQSALQTIMSLGSLGSTPEGKKVRRMLSNRESARRSRHRKQAHVHTLEERVIAMETENQRLKADLNRLTEQQVLHVNERLELQAEIGNLRKKIAQMEHAGSCGMPVKVEAAGSGASNKGGSLSSDSCCASKPGTRQALPIEPEHCSKKRRV